MPGPARLPAPGRLPDPEKRLLSDILGRGEVPAEPVRQRQNPSLNPDENQPQRLSIPVTRRQDQTFRQRAGIRPAGVGGQAIRSRHSESWPSL